jgi:hypothetical protein
MTVKDLDARIKALEKIVESQAAEIRTLKDIEEINRLQRAYGYYLEHWMIKEIVDLFSDSPEASLTLTAGSFLGKAGIKRYFEHHKPDNELLHQMMQLSGIVDVDPDGKTAKGRWYGFGGLAVPRGKGIKQYFMSGIYIAEYVKENGIWKFLKLQFDILYTATPLEGWVKPERMAAVGPDQPMLLVKADVPRSDLVHYPSGHITPFHYKHPVTRKKTSEDAWNAALKKSAKS